MIHRVIAEGKQLKMTGFGPAGVDLDGKRIRQGDYLILPNKESSTRYRVVTIDYERDPSDMWKATVEYCPRPGRVRP